MRKRPSEQGNTSPSTLVIFGATGNLAQRKLMPSLYQLEAAGHLAKETRIVGFSRREWSDDDWRERVSEQCLAAKGGPDRADDPALQRLLQRLHFHPGNHGDPDCFKRLAKYLDQAASVSYTHLTLPTIYSV